MSLIGAHNFFVVFDRTVAEVGFDGYASSVPEWAINGDDSSVHPNSWPVPKARYLPHVVAATLCMPNHGNPPRRIRLSMESSVGPCRRHQMFFTLLERYCHFLTGERTCTCCTLFLRLSRWLIIDSLVIYIIVRYALMVF